jgi:WD40 repeat protein/predicted Ser/Thr protein kinase
MPDERRDRLWALFNEAADLIPAEQRSLLDAACPDDPGLRTEVEKLLAADARLRADEARTDFLHSPLVRSPEEGTLHTDPVAFAAGPALPARVGGYRIVRLLGEGGMGAVYEAEQDSPRRPVALKVIRPGLISPALLKRFAREAQILGRLHHPGIAQIYEAGRAEDGQPFFAMEFVRGLPLNEYARRQRPDPATRLALVARVCDAVQHAHDQGVIHRDLKPGNILVDETDQPKVLDFGVARATDADLQTTTGRTEAGQLLGTFGYMSPEQVAGDPAALDNRSDVYALGVILFELLADRLPYRLQDLPLPEVALVIREREPSRLGAINSVFRGDVETIVAKALEKDRARRYASAGELAADIRRYLRHEPIRARPPSSLYQLRKFAQRHKALVGGLAGVLAALLLGLVGTTLFAVREAWERDKAEDNARVANDKTKAALYQAYRAQLAAAGAALQNHDVASAARYLDDETTAELRGWEWRHLRSRLDDSTSVIPLPAGESNALLAATDRLRIGAWTGSSLRLRDLKGGEHKALPLGPERRRLVAIKETRRGLRIVVWVGNANFELLDEAGQVLCRVEIPEVQGPTFVGVGPDGTRLVSGWDVGEGLRFAVFDAKTGKRTAVLDGHRDEMWAWAFSPDGTRFASGSEDGAARLWDTATGAPLPTCRGHTSKVLCTAFSPDGRRLVTASADGTVRQWDATTGGEVEAPYDRHTGEVVAAVYSPDGRWVASAGTDRTVRVWQATGRQDVAVLHGHTGTVSELAFDPAGPRLASLSRESRLSSAGDCTVRVWDVDPRVTVPVLRGHTSYVYPVACSPDGQWIASGGWDNTVRLWDARTGEQCAKLDHPGVVEALAFSPDGSWMVSGCRADDRLRVWDLATGRTRAEFRGPHDPKSLAVSPDGIRIAARGVDGNLSILDSATGREVAAATLESIGNRWPLAYCPDGRLLAVNLSSKTVALWDTQAHGVVAQFAGHTGTVYSAAFSPDGRRLVTAGADRTVRVWDVATGECRTLLGHTDEVFTAVFHPDGTRIASAGRDQAVWVWDAATGEEVARLPGHRDYVWSLAFSPKGRTLVSGSGDKTVRLWDTEPLQVRHDARRAVQAARPEAERLVDRLFREKREAPLVAQSLREDEGLSEPLRRAAFHALLRREQAGR